MARGARRPGGVVPEAGGPRGGAPGVGGPKRRVPAGRPIGEALGAGGPKGRAAGAKGPRGGAPEAERLSSWLSSSLLLSALSISSWSARRRVFAWVTRF